MKEKELKEGKEQNPEKENLGGIIRDGKKILRSFLLTIVAALLTVPLFIVAYRYFPDIIIPVSGGIRIDHVLLFIVLFALIRVLVYYIRNFIFGLLIFSLIGLTIGQIAGKYGFTYFYRQYFDLITYVGSNPVKIPFLKSVYKSIPDEGLIREAIDYGNPVVRDFAVSSAKKYFGDIVIDQKYKKLLQYFSVFRVMSQWEYIPDPKGEEYFAKASESVNLMAGDCDDYSILMAASIRVIGGEVRLVRTLNHLYPEVKVGKAEDLPVIIHLIKNKLFYKESLGEQIYYHEDDAGNIWLNFDYTNIYPGGKFMSEEVVGILNI